MSRNDSYFKTFLDSKAGTAKATQYHNLARLRPLEDYLKRKKIDLDDFNQKHLIAYMNELYPKYKPKTMNHIKAVTKDFLRFTFLNDFYSRFPNLINVCKSQKVKPTFDSSQMLKQEEVQKIIQSEYDPFWKLVYAMQFYGGCRPSEVCSLKWNDITFKDEGIYFKIYSAKNNKVFEKFVPNEYSFYMKELQKTSKSEFCFCKVDNKPITRHTFYVHLERLGKKVFPDKKITPYILRHSIATILYGKAEKGELNTDVVARQLGHSRSMKDIYVHMDEDVLRENARKIFIKPELTPEQKSKMEKEIEELKSKIAKQETFNKFLKESGLLNLIEATAKEALERKKNKI